MGVGAGLYMYDVVVKKVHVRYLISWWVVVGIRVNTQDSCSYLLRERGELDTVDGVFRRFSVEWRLAYDGRDWTSFGRPGAVMHDVRRSPPLFMSLSPSAAAAAAAASANVLCVMTNVLHCCVARRSARF